MRRRARYTSAVALGLLASAGVARAQGTPARPAPTAPAPEREYQVLVASESTDEIALVAFGPAGSRVVRTIPIGLRPSEPDGPHGLAVSPDGRFFYSTTAHGLPFGTLWKFDMATGEPVGQVELGNFPASMQLTPDGTLAFVVNFNLHGDMVPSTVSVVATGPMLEIARIETCTMPHGSRLTRDGRKHYSTCMMDDLLVEIDTHTLEVARHFHVGAGNEHGGAGAPGKEEGKDHGDHHAAHHPPAVPAAAPSAAPGAAAPAHDAANHAAATCSPTWSVPSASGDRVWVACNRSDEIVEVDGQTWALRRRIAAGPGVYNVAVTSDSRLLVATNKRGQSVSLIDVESGKELARIPTLRRIVHGVTISPDDRYAFISVEGIGSEPGTVEMIDLQRRARVTSADVGQQAGGIDLLPSGG